MPGRRTPRPWCCSIFPDSSGEEGTGAADIASQTSNDVWKHPPAANKIDAAKLADIVAYIRFAATGSRKAVEPGGRAVGPAGSVEHRPLPHGRGSDHKGGAITDRPRWCRGRARRLAGVEVVPIEDGVEGQEVSALGLPSPEGAKGEHHHVTGAERHIHHQGPVGDGLTAAQGSGKQHVGGTSGN